ncbi:hypothetical protein [Rhizobium sp. PAMB 3182]
MSAVPSATANGGRVEVSLHGQTKNSPEFFSAGKNLFLPSKPVQKGPLPAEATLWHSDFKGPMHLSRSGS